MTPEDQSNERKENRDFNQWLNKLNQVVKIYESLMNRTIPDEPVVDALNLFPESLRHSVATIFELTENLASMTKTRVKFVTKSQSLTLYDFSRCFTHENGSFKLHRAISAMRKQSLSVALFTSSKLGELCNDLVLSTEDYFELLYSYIQARVSMIKTIKIFRFLS